MILQSQETTPNFKFKRIQYVYLIVLGIFLGTLDFSLTSPGSISVSMAILATPQGSYLKTPIKMNEDKATGLTLW